TICLFYFQTVEVHVQSRARLCTGHGGQGQRRPKLVPTPTRVKSGHLELPVPLALFPTLRPPAPGAGRRSRGHPAPRPAPAQTPRLCPSLTPDPRGRGGKGRGQAGGRGRARSVGVAGGRGRGGIRAVEAAVEFRKEAGAARRGGARQVGVAGGRGRGRIRAAEAAVEFRKEAGAARRGGARQVGGAWAGPRGSLPGGRSRGVGGAGRGGRGGSWTRWAPGARGPSLATRSAAGSRVALPAGARAAAPRGGGRRKAAMAPWELSGSAVLAAAVFVGGTASSPLVAPDIGGSHTLHSRTETTPEPTNNTGNGHPEYIAYALVPVFFIMGLFGVLICHLLKKKGYRCTTEAEQEVEEEKVEKIANVDVLKAMVADNSLGDPESPVTPSTPGSPPVSPGPLSPGGTPGKHICGHHLHTVGGAVERDVCHRCRHKRWHFIRPTNKSKQGHARRQGEVTVLSVGRFRVTKVEHKSNQKERRSLMSVSGTDSVNGDVPATPVKREQSDTE
uniref:RELT like 1 n=1 Tax=Canis lupus familiaris TaxID=9615 RepID=A0A8C0PKL9_CANLF